MHLPFILGALPMQLTPSDFAKPYEAVISHHEPFPPGVWACLHHQGREISRGQTVVFSSDRSTTQ